MNKIINYILSKLIGVKRRYKSVLDAGESKFLPNFSIVKNRVNGMQKERVQIGNQCLLGTTIILEGDTAKVKIGDRVYMGNSSIICKSSVSFGNDILVAWGVVFYDHDSHSLDYRFRDQDVKQTYIDYVNEKGNYLKNKNWNVVNSLPIVIEDHAWIGAESMILKGVTIGKGAIVGARSVVTKDVPPFTVVAGNPAKVVKVLDIQQ
ncbi:putative acetyltransferase [compost metagenome]